MVNLAWPAELPEIPYGVVQLIYGVHDALAFLPIPIGLWIHYSPFTSGLIDRASGQDESMSPRLLVVKLVIIRSFVFPQIGVE